MGASDERVAGHLHAADGFEEEPGTAFGFIDPVFEQAGSGDVFMLRGDGMGFEHVLDELEIVLV